MHSAAVMKRKERIEKEGTELKHAPSLHQQSHSLSLQLTQTISIQSNTKIQVNKGPREQTLHAGSLLRFASSRIEFLPAGKNAYDPTRLCNNVHHSLDSRRSLHHTSSTSATAPAATMMVVMIIV